MLSFRQPSHAFPFIVWEQPEMTTQASKIGTRYLIVGSAPFAQGFDGLFKGGDCGLLSSFPLAEVVGGRRGDQRAECDAAGNLRGIEKADHVAHPSRFAAA